MLKLAGGLHSDNPPPCRPDQESQADGTFNMHFHCCMLYMWSDPILEI